MGLYNIQSTYQLPPTMKFFVFDACQLPLQPTVEKIQLKGQNGYESDTVISIKDYV